MRSLFLDALFCKPVSKPPVWLMRQAGRYLPSYKMLRQTHSLHSLFHDPLLATQVTLLPFELLDLDAAIVFSDLLVLAEVWGKQTVYPQAGGAFIIPQVESPLEIFIASRSQIEHCLGYVFETIRNLKKTLHVPLLGFAPAPFTLLHYMIDVDHWKQFRKEEFLDLLDKVVWTSILYAKMQFEAGVDALQIFDSWANVLSPVEFDTFALPYWKLMVDQLKPSPLLFFSRVNSLYSQKIGSIHPQGISFDEHKSLSALREEVPSTIAIQGNYSPVKLAKATVEEVVSDTKSMLASVQDKHGVILNLGHGVLPETPIENVVAFVQTIKS